MNYVDLLGTYFPDVEAWCHGDPTVMSDIIVLESGAPMPTQEQFETAYLKQRQDRKWADISNERDRRYYQGIQIPGVDGELYWFWTDVETRARYSMYDIAVRSLNLQSEDVLDNWKTMSGVFTPMTVGQLYRVIGAAMVNEKRIFNFAEAKKAEMLLLANPDEYDHLSGWPLCYSDTLV